MEVLHLPCTVYLGHLSVLSLRFPVLVGMASRLGGMDFLPVPLAMGQILITAKGVLGAVALLAVMEILCGSSMERSRI